MTKIIAGKEALTTLEEWVMPKHTALIVVDLQNDFCSAGGRLQQQGHNVETLRPGVKSTLKLVREARRAGVLIVYTKAKAYASGLGKSAPDLARKLALLGEQAPLIAVEGTWGYELIDELKPRSNEVIIEKLRHNAFRGTSLDVLLRSENIRTVIVTGVLTQRCVGATVRGAIELDYYVVLPQDCVGSTKSELQNAALLVMADILPEGGVVSGKDIVDVWKSYKARV